MKTQQILLQSMAHRARLAQAFLGQSTVSLRTQGLRAAASALAKQTPEILAANIKDMKAAKGLSSALQDRLFLDELRIAAMVTSLQKIAEMEDPVGQIIQSWQRPNGLKIERVRTPLGVLGIIYESRPNVTADAAGLAIRSGNAVLLRGGSESLQSSTTIAKAIRQGIIEAGLPEDIVQIAPDCNRDFVGAMLQATNLLDVLIPRGGRSLVARVLREARVPVFSHLDGNCHVYIHKEAEAKMAEEIVLNAKLRRTGICGAMETLLVDRTHEQGLLPQLVCALLDAGCRIRGDHMTQKVDKRVEIAEESDWKTEYLDAVLAVKTVSGPAQAITHINAYGSHHTDTIVTQNRKVAEQFLNQIESAIVMHNASTQFADGGEFGMGAEIGISTGRLHARGPISAEQLTSFHYRVRGNGQCRPK